MLSLCLPLTAACSKKAAPIALPPSSEISAIAITHGEEVTTHEDAAWIRQFAALVQEAKPTSKQSVDDIPPNVDFTAINLLHGDAISSFFFYEKDGEYYLEQPYQGIYHSDAALQSLLTGAA